MRVSQERDTHKIAMLDLSQNQLTLQVKCDFKGPVKTWKKNDSEGQLFAATFSDDSGSISMTFYREKCLLYYDLIKVGEVYRIQSYNIKNGGRFNMTTNRYELHSNS